MPSFSALFALTLSLLAVTPTLALESPAADLAARNLDFSGPLLGARSPLEKRAKWKCTSNWQCSTKVRYARPSCSAEGKCGFKCTGGTVMKGNKCIKPKAPGTCHTDYQCRNIHVQNGKSVCHQGFCATSCSKGYHLEGKWCVVNDTCSCKPISNGYSSCKGKKCSYHCAAHLGYTLFSNGKSYACVNLQSDPNNCGKWGHVCRPGYNHKGWPVCTSGKCGLDCAGYKHQRELNGKIYCTDF